MIFIRGSISLDAVSSTSSLYQTMKYQFVFQISYFEIVSLNWSKTPLIKSRQCRNIRPLGTYGLRGPVYMKVFEKFNILNEPLSLISTGTLFDLQSDSICAIRSSSDIILYHIVYAVSAVIIKWNDSTGIHLVGIVNSTKSRPC